MPTVQYRPTSPGRRFQTGFDFKEITKTEPEPSLTAPLRKSGGRNNLGRITLRHRGGGHKRLYRIIDFKRDKVGVPARVAAIECSVSWSSVRSFATSSRINAPSSVNRDPSAVSASRRCASSSFA